VKDDPLTQNLRRARVSRGLTQADLASKAGLSRVAYRNIETGAAQPRVDSLVRLAAVLDLKIDELLAPARTTLTTVRFRARKKMNSREDVLVRVSRWLHDYAELERLLGDTQRFQFEPLAKKLERLDPGAERAMRAATEARKTLGLKPEEGIRDICGLLEDHGVKIYPLELASADFFGLSVSSDDGGPAIVVNVWDRITVERWIFTAAHELGHLLLHLRSYDVTNAAEDKAQEKEADIFASHFLMPESVFQREWKEARGLPVVDRVFKVKGIFKVSWKTVLYRAFPNDRDIFRRFPFQYRDATGKTLGPKDEPMRIARTEFLGDRRDRLIRQALENKSITTSRAAELLGLNVEKMHERMALWTA
jgi:Zn-dependent peptidase ImmA (M78 family)/DNA-binding XRE family transcriptional regulator